MFESVICHLLAYCNNIRHFFSPYQHQPPSPTSPKEEEGEKLPEQHLPQAANAVSTNSQSQGWKAITRVARRLFSRQ